MDGEGDARASEPNASGNAGPLAGIRVLDLTVALAGPYCTLLLGGLGAEVIKVEAPGGNDLARENPPYLGRDGINLGERSPGEFSVSELERHRCKKSVTLDLKAPEGRELLFALVKKCDVLVENFSAGTAERLGIGYDAVRAVNPQIIYASISAFGDAEDYPGLKGMDITVQALSGVMDVNGFPDRPPCRVGFPVADLAAPHYALSGILAALLHRTKTGRGQKVEVNMLDSLVALLALEHFDLTEQSTPLRTGNYHDRLTPFGVYQTKDGHVAIAASADRWTKNLLKAIGREDLVTDKRFASRGERRRNAPALNGLIEDWCRIRTAAAVIQDLTRHDVPAVRVRGPREALNDPAVRRRGAVVSLTHPKAPNAPAITAVGLPIRFSECRVGYDKPASEIGEDNDEVYSRLAGLDATEVARLRAKSIL